MAEPHPRRSGIGLIGKGMRRVMAKKKRSPAPTAADYAADWFEQYYMDDECGGYMPKQVFVNYIQNHDSNLEWQLRREAKRIDAALTELKDAHANIRRLAKGVLCQMD